MAVRQFAQENNGVIPGRGQGQMPMDGSASANIYNSEYWYNRLPLMMNQRSFGQMFDSDSIPRPGRGFGAWICPESVVEYPANKVFFSYGQNMALSPTMNVRPDRMQDIGPEQTMVYMAESAQRFGSVWPTLITQPKEYNPVTRHMGKTNIAFLDGHVQLYARGSAGLALNPMTTQSDAAEVRWKTPANSWSGPTLP